jgi:hypothetical protein
MEYLNNYGQNGHNGHNGQNGQNGQVSYQSYVNPFVKQVKHVKIAKKRNTKMDKIKIILKGVSIDKLAQCGNNPILMNNMLLDALASIRTISEE